MKINDIISEDYKPDPNGPYANLGKSDNQLKRQEHEKDWMYRLGRGISRFLKRDPDYDPYNQRDDEEMWNPNYRPAFQSDSAVTWDELEKHLEKHPAPRRLGTESTEVDEDLRAWFGKGKKGGAGGGGWDRYNTKGERIGKCGDSKEGEGKPKCLSKSRAASLRASGGKKAIANAVKRKKANDPNPDRKGKAKNVNSHPKK